MENEGATVASSPGRRFCSTGIDGQPSDRDGQPSSLEAQFGALVMNSKISYFLFCSYIV
jgi:hypothetical protein